jgi:hypothetical protein
MIRYAALVETGSARQSSAGKPNRLQPAVVTDLVKVFALHERLGWLELTNDASYPICSAVL